MMHEMKIVPAGKMDAPALVRAVCSCGSYQSGVGDRVSAAKAWGQHTYAKLKEHDVRRSRFRKDTLVVSGETLLDLVDLLREVDAENERGREWLDSGRLPAWHAPGGFRDRLETLLGLQTNALNSKTL